MIIEWEEEEKDCVCVCVGGGGGEKIMPNKLFCFLGDKTLFCINFPKKNIKQKPKQIFCSNSKYQLISFLNESI